MFGFRGEFVTGCRALETSRKARYGHASLEICGAKKTPGSTQAAVEDRFCARLGQGGQTPL